MSPLEAPVGVRRLSGLAIAAMGFFGIASVVSAPALAALKPHLISVAVAPTVVTIATGLTTQLTATATYSSGPTADVTARATWTSSNPAVISVSNVAGSEGLVTALASGTATVSAKLKGKTGSATVTASSLLQLVIDPSTAYAALGDSQQFTATGHLANGSDVDITSDVTWSSSALSIATIDASGLAFSHALGTVRITARRGVLSDIATFNVGAALPRSVSVSPDPISVPADGSTSAQLTAILTFSDGTTTDVTSDPNVAWATSDASTAVVTSTGLVTGTGGVGSAEITATWPFHDYIAGVDTEVHGSATVNAQ